MTIRDDEKLKQMLIESDALLQGHFLLSSGLHSDKYIQCAKLTQYPKYSNYVAGALSELYKNEKIDVVIGGAFGGIVLAYAMASILNVRNIFAERIDGKFSLRRGFEIKKGERVLIAEDVCTTGKSILEVKELINEYDGETIGSAIIIDRCEEKGQELGIRKEWLLSVNANTYEASNCPLCKEGNAPIKPGSRK